MEAWFKTTTTTGGKIIGFGNRQMGLDFNSNPAVSGSYDKHIYMTNDGRLVFGVWVGGAVTLTSTPCYNDGQYHHVVGTLGARPAWPYTWTGSASAATARPPVRASRGGGGWAATTSVVGRTSPPAGSSRHHRRRRGLPVGVGESRRGSTTTWPPVVPAPPSIVPADAYGASVFNDSPISFWRLDETSGTTAADTSDNGNTGQYVGGVTHG